MSDVDGTPTTGADRATHRVAEWLRGDSDFREDARNEAAPDVGDGFADLHRFVEHVLYGPQAHYPRDVRRALAAVREDVPREDLDGIDWEAVRESLLAE